MKLKLRHHGPGPHDTGRPQSGHAGAGGGVSDQTVFAEGEYLPDEPGRAQIKGNAQTVMKRATEALRQEEIDAGRDPAAPAGAVSFTVGKHDTDPSPLGWDRGKIAGLPNGSQSKAEIVEHGAFVGRTKGWLQEHGFREIQIGAKDVPHAGQVNLGLGSNFRPMYQDALITHSILTDGRNVIYMQESVHDAGARSIVETRGCSVAHYNTYGGRQFFGQKGGSNKMWERYQAEHPEVLVAMAQAKAAWPRSSST